MTEPESVERLAKLLKRSFQLETLRPQAEPPDPWAAVARQALEAMDESNLLAALAVRDWYRRWLLEFTPEYQAQSGQRIHPTDEQVRAIIGVVRVEEVSTEGAPDRAPALDGGSKAEAVSQSDGLDALPHAEPPRPCGHADYTITGCHYCQGIEEGRGEAFEECAKIADRHRFTIAAAIRAAARKERRG